MIPVLSAQLPNFRINAVVRAHVGLVNVQGGIQFASREPTSFEN